MPELRMTITASITWCCVLHITAGSVWNAMQSNLKSSVLHWHQARRGAEFFCLINFHLGWGSRLKLIGGPCGAAWVSRRHHWRKFKHYLLSGLTRTSCSVVQLIKTSHAATIPTNKLIWNKWLNPNRKKNPHQSVSANTQNLQKG